MGGAGWVGWWWGWGGGGGGSTTPQLSISRRKHWLTYTCTLRASLSRTFLQTLPDLVSHWRGTLYLRAAVHRRGQRPPKGSGTNCRSNLAPKHPRKHETHPPRVKKRRKKGFRLDSNDCGFICAGVKFVGGYKWHALFYLLFFVTNFTYYCLSTNKKLLVSWQFSGPYVVTKHGSGWRNDVVNQCLEFDTSEERKKGMSSGSWIPYQWQLKTPLKTTY